MQTATTHLHPILFDSAGSALCTAPEIVLKGCLQCDWPIDLLIGPTDSWFGRVLRIAGDDTVAALLRAHQMRVQSTIDGNRAVALALQAARAGKRAVVVLANESLESAFAAGGSQRDLSLPAEGSLSVLIEDAPMSGPSPLRVVSELGLCCLYHDDLDSVRRGIEHGLILSRASRRPVAGLIHAAAVHSLDTLPCQPNRVVESTDVNALLRRRRRRRIRLPDDVSVIQAVRRLELNRFSNLPSPGERVEAAFVLVGPTVSVMQHILYELGLTGRVPLLDLSVVSPADTAAISRFLARCEHAIVVEPRPGEVETEVLRVAEQMRRRGERPATVWGRLLPPVEGQAPHILQPNEAISSSVLARRLLHLLHRVRPGRQIAGRLVADVADGLPALDESALAEAHTDDAEHDLRRILDDVGSWLRTRAPLAERQLPPSELVMDRESARAARTVRAEIWRGRDFLTRGRSAVLHAASSSESWIFAVLSAGGAEHSTIQRSIGGFLSADQSRRVAINSAARSDRSALRNALREACLGDQVTILLIDPHDPLIPGGEEETTEDVDRQGFRRLAQFFQPADQACEIRPERHQDISAARVVRETRGGVAYRIDRLSSRLHGRVRVRLRPMIEWSRVVRSRPPLVASSRGLASRLPAPKILHGNQPVWRAHFAGTRGESPGIAVGLLCEAGRAQGYHVRCEFDDTPIRGDRAAWAQVVFSRSGEHEPDLPLTARIPWGDADLLLGLDPVEAVNACRNDSTLRVAHPSVTTAVVTVQPDGSPAEADGSAPSLESALAALMRDGGAFADFSEPARAMFGTERPTDLVILGNAFQRGLIPLLSESFDDAFRILRDRGFERCREAFELGRRLALAEPAQRQAGTSDPGGIERLLRRAQLDLSMETRRFQRMSADFKRLASEAIRDMPGLSESEAGRKSQTDFVRAMERCVRWGGIVTARTYRDLIVDLYRADRGDRGRALTRHAILPLAEAMLIRDQAYTSTMAVSLQARRLLRDELNAKPSRGDQVMRRFINRLECIALGYRLRVDFRTSDWPAWIMSRISRLWPNRWRGSRAERERRQCIIDVVRRAAQHADQDYDAFDAMLRALHDAAVAQRIRHLSAPAVRRLIEDAGEIDDLTDERAILDSSITEEQDETGVPIAQG